MRYPRQEEVDEEVTEADVAERTVAEMLDEMEVSEGDAFISDGQVVLIKRLYDGDAILTEPDNGRVSEWCMSLRQLYLDWRCGMLAPCQQVYEPTPPATDDAVVPEGVEPQ